MLVTASPASAATFTPGNIVVVEVFDGPLSPIAATVTLQERNPVNGAVVQQISMPTSASGSQNPLTLSGNAATEGGLTRSAYTSAGSYLAMAGYGAPPGTSDLFSGFEPRVAGRIDRLGNLDTTTIFPGIPTSQHINSAYTHDGLSFWAVSSNEALRWQPLGATGSATTVSNTFSDLRNVSAFGGQLYVSSAASTMRLGSVGSGVPPTTTGQTITGLPGFPTAGVNANAFQILNLSSAVAGLDTLYVADDAGGILKYSLVGGSWTSNGSIALSGARGLAASVDGTGAVHLYATSPTVLAKATDPSGYNGAVSGSATTIASVASPAGIEAFRGVAMAPALAPDASPSPSSKDFGNVPTGTQSPAQTITITNSSGRDALNISALSVTGAFANQFTIQNNTCDGVALTAGGSCTVSARFEPTSDGAKQGTISIASSDPDGTVAVPLSGTGSAPPDIQTSASSLNFGNVRVGTSSSAQQLTISNLGGAALSIASTAIGNAAFTKSDDNCTGQSVAEGGSCSLKVTFSPSSAGSVNSQMTIMNDDPDEPSTIVSLSGTGVEPVASVAPTSLAFGNVGVGASAPAQTVTVSNTGTQSLALTSLALGGASPGQFARTGGTCVPPQTIPVTGSCTAQIVYSPTSAGGAAASLNVSSDGGSPSVALSGTGVQPIATAAPTSLCFGDVTVGSSAPAQTVTVSNTGTQSLALTSLALGGASPGQFARTGGTCAPPQSIPVSGSCTAQIAYSPTAAGGASASLNVSSDGGSPSVGLSGAGIAAAEPPVEQPPAEGPSVLPTPSDYTRTLTIRFSRKRQMFTGQLGSLLAGCVAGQQVTVFARRSGPDRKLAAATTAEDGGWRKKAKGTGGRAYAIASRSTLPNGDACLEVTSKAVKAGR
jgi:hypothetical protein